MPGVGARHIKNNPPPGALEELWKARPEAGLDDLDAAAEGGGDAAAAAELMPVALKYEDAGQYQVCAFLRQIICTKLVRNKK